MLLAVRHPAKHAGKKRTSEETSEAVSDKRLQQARSVIEFCPELIEQVIDGKLGLDEALREFPQLPVRPQEQRKAVEQHQPPAHDEGQPRDDGGNGSP